MKARQQQAHAVDRASLTTAASHQSPVTCVHVERRRRIASSLSNFLGFYTVFASHRLLLSSRQGCSLIPDNSIFLTLANGIRTAFLDMKHSTCTLIQSVAFVLLIFLSSCKSANGRTKPITYDVVERGEVNGRSFEKFRATNNTTVEHWAHTIKSGHDESIRELVTLVSESSYSAFYFETQPVRADTASHQPFEFVLVEAPSLAERQPVFQPFIEACSQAISSDEYGCVFSNLSGDATLVVPKPISTPEKMYTHVASFNRKAPDRQITSLWKMVAAEYIRRMSSSAVWLSTAGNGVPWLHFRLDRRPKYYRYIPYKRLRHSEQFQGSKEEL